MAHAIKFLHASDLHLDRAIRGLDEVPPHLKSTIVNAPYLAADNVFQLAHTEKVDFVLLAGDVVDLEAGGPRAAAFLLNHFERLAEKGIGVYWCNGEVDQPDRWPAAASLPDNVVTFTSSGFEESVCRKNGLPVATIYGAGFYSSRSELPELRADSSAAYPIAMTHFPLDKPVFDGGGIRYWALGGSHERSMVERPNCIEVRAGTPQARSMDESGPRGCCLVTVDVTGKPRVEQIPVDVVRWLPQKLSFAESASDEDIKNLLADRAFTIAAETPDQVVLIDWQITTTGDFNPRLRSSEWRQKMISWLRTEFGSSAKALWTTHFEIDPTRTLPQNWFDEDTMLGDYLRAIGKFQSEPQLSLPLHPYVPSANTDDSLADMARVADAARGDVLREATLIGVERLGGFVEKD